MKVYFYENGQFEKATDASIFKQSNNANTLTLKLPMAKNDSIVYANFLLPFPKGSDQYGNYSVESMKMSIEQDEADGGYQWSAPVTAGYLNNYGTAYLSVQIQSNNGTTTKTTERVKFEIQSSGDYNATAVTPEQADQINAALARAEANIVALQESITGLQDTKQDKADNSLETTAKTVVGAINENKGRIETNATNIANNTTSIAKNRNDIDFLQENMQLAQRYIGRMSGTTLPTEAQLTQFVRDTTESDPLNGDTIIFVEVIPNATDKVFKYFYTASKWQNYEIPAIESAQNGSLGSVQGTYAIGDTGDTLVDISGGKILNIYVLDSTGAYRNIVEYLNSTTENVAKIVNGDTVVGNALRAVADGVGNNIVNTYLTQALGATKAYVRDYAMPREFNDVDFISSSGFVDEVPTTPESGVQFTATTSAVGDSTLFDIEKTNKADFELSSKNGSSNIIYVACNKTITATFRLTTSYKRSTLEWQDLAIELTEPITFTAGEIQKLTFGAPFTALGQSVVKLTDGDKIKQTLEVISTTSAELKWSVYSNDTYPSTFNLTSQSYTMGALDALQGVHIQLGADGVIEANRVVFTVADAESYVDYKTNGREFLLNLHLPVAVASVNDLDQTLPVAITFGDTTYNLYNYQLGANTPLTIGNIMSVARYDSTTGFTFDFKATYFENAEIVGFGIIPSAITATQIDLITTTGSGLKKALNGTKLNIDLADSTKNTLTTHTSEITALQERTASIESAYVSYGAPQELTDEQKAQARNNIGAGSAGFGGSYGELTGKPTLDTTSTATLATNASETINGSVKLHKVAKTGKLADLITDSTHATLSEAQRTQIGTNSTNIGTLQSGLSQAEQDIADNMTSIGTNTADIATNKANIEKNSQNIATAQNDINALKAQDVEHGESIETLQNGKMDKTDPVGSGSFSFNRKADTTIGTNSFAEGYNTTASGGNSHAENNNTTASGGNSHAEGNWTLASGSGSHSEGDGTQAKGSYSHAQGSQTIANGNYQHVMGRYNVADTTSAEIVGNGTANDVRGNARVLDWSGNEWLAGQITINGSGTIKYDASTNTFTF